LEQYHPPHRSLHLLKFLPCLDPLPKSSSKMHRFSKHGAYISTFRARGHSAMSTELDMNVSGSPLTPLSSVISGVPSTLLSLVVWMLEAPLSSATQPMSFARPMGTNPFVFLCGMSNHDSQSIPSASNPFYFGILDMTSHFSSSVSTNNMNPSFGYGGTTPPYVPFSFGGGHIPEVTPTVGVWNPPSSRPNPSFNAPGWSAQMGGQFTSYIMSVIPSSSTSIMMNAFIMVNPLQSSGVPYGGSHFYGMGNP
jgi:hypothetical protein